MFSSLRQGSTLYILRKSGKPTLEIAEVASTTQPTMFQPDTFGRSTMNISARVGDQTYNFEKIDSSLAIASDGAGTTIAENRELMQTEVENMLSASQQILASIDRHTMIVSECKSILQELNPQIRQEQERENRLASLESKMEQILEALSGDLKNKNTMIMIQISDSKKEKMSECAEKVLRYAGKLMSCIEELGSDERYGERREMDNDDYDDSERYGERGGRMRRPRGSFRY